MRLAAVDGITPVPLGTPEDTAARLTAAMIAARGPESAHDPGVAQSAREAADLAAGAHLLAVVTHPAADPAILTALTTTVDHPHGTTTAADLVAHLTQSDTDLHDVAETTTAAGHPVIIAERLTPTGCQLQAVVLDPGTRRIALFTLHSPTGRGWLDTATLLGRLITTVEFEPVIGALP
ncbi:hypothetical protein [Actinokineospora inagensis]|uniref:hypothetical protein n=1 Tax=Actinokineospora inagensis TaxID=103730 RepID=UPI00041F904B|nr:hypothetical protein [Actinokineospora inagensis]